MPSSPSETSPLLDLLAQVEREIHLRRQTVLDLSAPLEAALAAYRRALEHELMADYATAHQHRVPKTIGPGRRAAAQQLLALVAALPELEEPERSASDSPAREDPGAAGPSASQVGDAPSPPRGLADVLPRIAQACRSRRLAIVGALAGRKKPLPEPLEDATDWIDTEGGSHAAVGLPSRIKQGRVFGVIICDQSVSHKHSEPLVAAARSAKVPVGFAGKGGAGAIARALEAIEEQLATGP